METILATAFGRQVNVLKGEDDELAEAASGLFSGVSTDTFVWIETFVCKKDFITSILIFLLF